MIWNWWSGKLKTEIRTRKRAVQQWCASTACSVCKVQSSQNSPGTWNTEVRVSFLEREQSVYLLDRLCWLIVPWLGSDNSAVPCIVVYILFSFDAARRPKIYPIPRYFEWNRIRGGRRIFYYFAFSMNFTLCIMCRSVTNSFIPNLCLSLQNFVHFHRISSSLNFISMWRNAPRH